MRTINLNVHFLSWQRKQDFDNRQREADLPHLSSAAVPKQKGGGEPAAPDDKQKQTKSQKVKQIFRDETPKWPQFV